MRHHSERESLFYGVTLHSAHMFPRKTHNFYILLYFCFNNLIYRQKFYVVIIQSSIVKQLLSFESLLDISC